MQQVRVVVIGYGHLGKWHVDKVLACAEAQLVAVIESFPAAQSKLKETHPQIKVVSDWREIVNEFDAAFVVTPTSTHFEIVLELLKTNKHVFCEKPLCSTLCEVQELAPFIGNKKLQVGHSERFHAVWNELRPIFLGLDKTIVNIRRVAPFKGRATDVDVVQDLMIHDLDLFMFLFNKKIISVEATGLKMRTQHYDYVRARYETADGSVLTIDAGRNNAKEERSLEVMHKSGCYYVDLFKREWSTAPSSEVTPGVFVATKDYPARDHLMEEHKAFYQSVLQNTPIVVDYQAGERAVYLIQKTIESLDTNRKVTLP
jgi:predicted dehydrogenase